jgi:hypothetical protein
MVSGHAAAATAFLLTCLPSPFTTHHSPLTIHHSPFTIHPSPFLDSETLRPVSALPAHVCGRFEDPTGFQQSADGIYYIFDRRSHTVFAYTPGADAPKKVIQIGAEAGRVIQPSAFDFAPDNTFVVADAPNRRERIQIFSAAGSSLGGFSLDSRAVERIAIGDFVLNGVGSLEYTGASILIGQPETGALITEYGVNGRTKRTFGELRRTGHESDPELHAALNVAVPIVIPAGGYYVVFLTGVPVFRKYDAAGTFIFERHIEGIEIDQQLRALPTTWKARRPNQGEAAIVAPSVRTAALDRDGNLWISLTVPYTYVYDPDGDKRRVVQFRATGLLSPASLFFTKDNRLLVTPGCYAFSAK